MLCSSIAMELSSKQRCCVSLNISGRINLLIKIQELHRLAYNSAFLKYNLQLANGQSVHWDVPYCELITINLFHFNNIVN